MKWFQIHVRVVTIIAAIVVTVLLQLDTIEISDRLRDQPELVEALVKSAPSILEQGGAVIGEGGAPFWFNLLKNLTSLRPALANLIEKRPHQRTTTATSSVVSSFAQLDR